VQNEPDIEFIKRSILFQGALPATSDRMIERCRLANPAPGSLLFRAGRPVLRVYLVLEGVIELYRGAEDGKHAVLGLREVGEIAGASAALSGIDHYSTAQTVGKCQVLEVPVSVFNELLTDDPDLARRLTSRLADNLQLISEHMERLQLMQTTERLASYLLSMVRENNESLDFLLPCDKGLIATYLGMERESFSRSLKKLRSLGVISKGRRIHISDPAALKSLCQSELAR
jgi:CRP-like cAMP-binding protein